MKSRPRKGRGEAPPPPAVPEVPATSSLAAEVRRHGWIVAALWALVLAANVNSFRDGFPHDNRAAILLDERVHAATPENIHLLLTQDYWPKQPASLYRPLTSLSYLFNYVTLGNGTHPAGYHAINLLLHAINVALVYALGLLLFRHRFWAAAMAALWCVHPLLTESVTNIVGRADLLAGLGVLGGLLCYIYSARTKGRTRLAFLAAGALAVAVGMFSKESGIVVLAALVLWDVAFPETTRGRRLGGYAAIGLGCAAYLAVRFSVMSKMAPVLFPYPDNPLVGADFLTGRLTAVKVLGKYLWLLVWPARLSCDYSYNQVPLFGWNLSRADDWKALFALACCLALAALAVVCYRRNRIAFFCIGLFFAVLAPTSNLVMLAGTIMAERFLYLPAIAFACVLALTVKALCEKYVAPARVPQAAGAILGIICLAFGARTFARNFDWYDEVHLYGANLVSSPNSFRTHNGLAEALATAQPPDLDRAAAEGQRSIEILGTLPDDRSESPPYAYVGYIDRLKGDAVAPAPESRQWYQKSVDVLLRGSRVDRATGARTIQHAAESGITLLRSGWPPLYVELGRSYLRLSEPAKALEALKYGRSISPDSEFFEEMANAYRALGDNDQVAVTFLEGLGVNLQNSRLARLLVAWYKETAPQSCALITSAGGSRLNLNCPMVHTQLCTAQRNVVALYNELGRQQSALDTARGAVSSLSCPAALFQ